MNVMQELLELQQQLLDKCSGITDVVLCDASDVDWVPNSYRRGLMFFPVEGLLPVLTPAKSCVIVRFFQPRVIGSSELIPMWALHNSFRSTVRCFETNEHLLGIINSYTVKPAVPYRYPGTRMYE